MEKLLELEKGLEVTTTNIPDLLIINLPVDSLAGKKWHQEKFEAFGPHRLDLVQSALSISANQDSQPDVHAESDRYLFVETGRIFSSCVDLRQGKSFGRTYMTDINPSKAVFVPRGVNCSFQTLDDSDNTVLTYTAPDA